MKRALPVLLLAVGVAAILLAVGSSSAPYDFAAQFDTVSGMVPGQVVDVAGARVGTVSAVNVQRTHGGGYIGLMRMSIERRFHPFYANATCQILPEGLISEDYVECNPGTAGHGPLPTGPAGVPTIPLADTSAPLSLEDVLNTFSLPTDQRLALLLDTLGIGTAGRGEDINGILQRANPALTQASSVLSILDAQNHQIADAVGQTSLVLGRLAQHSGQVRQFVDQAAALSRATALHSSPLAQAVHELPAMLDAVQGGLRTLDGATQSAVPLLHDLRASAPGLAGLAGLVPTFTDAAVPALRAVGSAAAAGRRAIPPALPVVAHLNTFAAHARPVVEQLDDLLVSTRDTGGLEGLLTFVYNYAGFTAPYDKLGHFANILLDVFPECITANTLRETLPGCRHSYNAPGMGQAPINDPAVSPGPLTAAMYRVPGVGSAAPTRRATPVSAAQLRAVLNYLLK